MFTNANIRKKLNIQEKIKKIVVSLHRGNCAKGALPIAGARASRGREPNTLAREVVKLNDFTYHPFVRTRAFFE